MIEFFVPGPPVAQQRAKTIFVKGRVIGKYDPQKCKMFKNLVKQYAAKAFEGRAPFQGPVGLFLRFCLPRPKSISPKKRPLPITNPDIDNLYKGVADALEWIAYERDQQVVLATIDKTYASDGQPVGVQVRIQELSA